LRSDLRHRLRPMSGRDPAERGRSATPIELLYDLTYVIAFAAAAEQLAAHLSEGDVGAAIGAYAFAAWSISWAWLNFTWFASAYGNDDALFRVATIVQMVGVVVLTFGLPVSFSDAAEGHSPNNALLVVGYVIMRVPLIALWLRAAREDPEHRSIDVAYAVLISAAQTGWILTTAVDLAVVPTVAALVVLAVGEMVAPVVLERRLGTTPWNAGHIAERFALLTLITLGEVIAATTSAVGALTHEQGWSVAAAVIAASGLVLASGLWWAYYLIPSRAVLERWRDRTFTWRYVHLPMFGAIAAVGAGLRVAAGAVEKDDVSVLLVAIALAVPVAIVITLIFLTWSVLVGSYDLSHVPLFLAALAPLAAAIVIAAKAGPGPIDPDDASQTVALVAVIALVALCAVVEVVGHEIVGYRHTADALDEATGRS
jgi:low temperature requirement protein LtrA